MTRTFTTVVGAGFLSLSMAMLPLNSLVNAQVTSQGEESTSRTVVYERRDFDWGWLGLIGLFGLAGLARKQRSEEPTVYRDPSAPGATTYRE